jgi:ribosomal protein S12 methylthiotransferase accessory factor
MLRQPGFKPHYHLEVVDGDGIVLLSETGPSVLPGRLYALVAPWIDGRRSPEDIARLLRDRASPAEVDEALARLEERGYLAENEGGLPAGEAALWCLQDIDPRAAVGRLEETTLSVAAVGGVAAEPFVAVLRSLRVRVGNNGHLAVVLTDDYLRAGLEAYNEAALDDERPWLLVKPVGREIWLGPVFRPGRTGCWECLAQRLRGNRAVESFLQRQKGSPEPLAVARACSPATLQVAWGLAAVKVVEWIARRELPDLEGAVLTLDVCSGRAQRHALVWRPQCPACGDAADGPTWSAAPVVLQSRRKAFTQDGGHRALAPEVTLQRYEHHVSPITGAVSRLERWGASSNGPLHAYDAGPNFAVRQPTLEGLRRGLRSRSGGKGASDLQARASGLCEALERYSGVFRGEEPRRRARFRDLGGAALHPNACMGFSEQQYRQRDSWNARGPHSQFVPLPFDEGAAIDWTPVWSLTRQEPRLLPTAFCYYRYPAAGGEVYCVANSNGCAAGNTPEEAILQGFLELVERDGVALWWYNRLRRPAVDLDSFAEPYLAQLAAHLRQRRRDLWVLDLTSDLGIPVFAALSKWADRLPEEIVFGFGAHLDPRVAVLRAVGELNQMLVWVLEKDQLPRDPAGEGEVGEWLRTATLAGQPYLAPDDRTPPRAAAACPRLWTEDLGEDVRACQALVERHGLEMLVLDQTRADIGLPVVKVIVPGLRHFWPRFAAGRLYEVPVQLGWLPGPLREEQLNPIPLFW